MLFQATHKTPVGDLFLVSDEHILLAAGFRNFKDLFSRMDSADRNRDVKTVKNIPIISELVKDYFDGDLTALGGIKVRQPGAEFSQEVWKAMRKIAPGKTWSYSDLAEKAGSPAAVRAAGSACANNAIMLVVPCHRVVKTGGALGNYAYGVDKKQWLLSHEGFL